VPVDGQKTSYHEALEQETTLAILDNAPPIPNKTKITKIKQISGNTSRQASPLPILPTNFWSNMTLLSSHHSKGKIPPKFPKLRSTPKDGAELSATR